MRITVLVENTSRNGLPVEHGLSLHIALDDGCRILFDMGQTDLFARNAEALHLDLSQVNLAVLSHGHYDHGGGLSHFLELNSHAPVCVHRDAFQPHYSLRPDGLHFIGIDDHPARNPRVLQCGGIVQLPSGGKVFSLGPQAVTDPPGNRLLYGPDGRSHDDFGHEQSLLLVEGDCRVLFAGCAHAGIVSIVNRATELLGLPPTHVIGGMHLLKSGLSAVEEEAHIKRLAKQLLQVERAHYFTMHCTGVEQYHLLRSLMPGRISYLSCGDTLEIHALQETLEPVVHASGLLHVMV